LIKPTSEILKRINKSSTVHKNGVFTRLYRYLLRDDIYYASYQGKDDEKETQEDTCRLWQVPFTRYSWLNYFRVC